MIDLPFGQIREILCLGAHCDDIEIGCGGAIQKLVAANPGVRVRWVVFSSDAERAAEARASAPLFTGEASLDVRVEDFRGRYFPYVGDRIKEYFDRLALETPQPDLVFTHYRFDLHQDHRLLSDLTYNTFRDHLVLEYEIPKWDGDTGQPNTYVPLDEALCERKVAVIWESFPSQRDKHWFTKATFWALLRLRGIEAKAPSGYAEGFHCRKAVLV
jgi:LmbE family N-acetylglucosaminyl deacetylase